MSFHIKVFLPALLITCLAAQHAHAQCPVADPVISDTCVSRSSQVQLSVVGSTGFYNWYDTASADEIVGSGSTYLTPSLTSDKTFYVAAIDTNASLTLDGNTSYIALMKSYDAVGALPQLTVEAWVKTTVANENAFGNWAIIDYDRSEYFNLFVRGDNGEVGFSTAASSGGIDDFYSGVPVNDGIWHHIAAVYDGTDKLLYVDGLLVATRTNPHGGQAIGTGVTRFGFIGDGSEADVYNGGRNGLHYNGVIDEVRLWNDVRTPTELIDYKNYCLTGSEPNLVSYYDFNENSGSIIQDVSGQGADGEIFNLDVTSAWGVGAYIGCDCQSAVVPVTVSKEGNLEDTLLSCGTELILDAGSSATSYNWSTGETTQTITVTENGFYEVQKSGGTCSGTVRIAVDGFSNAETALQFDGVNDYVAIDNMYYDRSDIEELTVETWVRTNNSGDQIIASFDRSEYWRLEINGDGGGNGQIGFDIATSAGILDFGSNRRIDDGQWHHVACIFDNGRVEIHIDGILDASTTRGATFGSRVRRYGFLGTGSEAGTFNGSTGPNSRFDGQIDEFRIWSRALSQVEIRTNMAKHIPGNADGLEVYYKFDNISLNTVFDHSTRVKQDAFMYSFGAGAEVISTAPIGDESTFLYTNSWTGKSLTLPHCSGESLTVSDMSGSPIGVHLYSVGRVPDEVSGILGLGSNDRYFGVHKIDDAAATYTATYDYTGGHASGLANELSVALYRRADRASSPWVDTGAAQDVVANTLTATASSTEFILGSTGTPLPIELLTFGAELNNEKVDIRWVTASEIDNDYFTVERSQDGVDWHELSVTPGAGNSSAVISYKETDKQPLDGLSYYRLKQTDFNGDFSYSKSVYVYRSGEEADMILFPNPLSHGEGVNIQLLGLQGASASITLRDLSGKLLSEKIVPDSGDERILQFDFVKALPRGAYIVSLYTTSQVINQRLIVD